MMTSDDNRFAVLRRPFAPVLLLILLNVPGTKTIRHQSHDRQQEPMPSSARCLAVDYNGPFRPHTFTSSLPALPRDPVLVYSVVFADHKDELVELHTVQSVVQERFAVG